MLFAICPACKRIKFSINGKITWVKLLPEEEYCLDTICSSEYLLPMVGGYDPQEEYCDECDLIEKN